MASQHEQQTFVSGRGRQWWHGLSDECCPLSLVPLGDLENEPFGLLGTLATDSSELPTAGVWGPAAVATLRAQGDKSLHWFDGAFLASFLVSGGNFFDPVNRRALSRGECISLDEYLEAHDLPQVFVTEAFDLSKSVNCKSLCAQGEARAAQLRYEATLMMNSLFNVRKGAVAFAASAEVPLPTTRPPPPPCQPPPGGYPGQPGAQPALHSAPQEAPPAPPQVDPHTCSLDSKFYGVIKSYSADNGFGFLFCAQFTDESQIYFSKADIPAPCQRGLKAGDHVSFYLYRGSYDGNLQARRVTPGPPPSPKTPVDKISQPLATDKVVQDRSVPPAPQEATPAPRLHPPSKAPPATPQLAPGTPVLACFYGEWHPGHVRQLQGDFVEIHWDEEESMSILPKEAVRRRSDPAPPTKAPPPPKQQEPPESAATPVTPNAVQPPPPPQSVSADVVETSGCGWKEANGWVKKYFADKGFGFISCSDPVCMKSDGQLKDVYFPQDALLPEDQNGSIIGARVTFHLYISQDPRGLSIRRAPDDAASMAAREEGVIKLYNQEKGFGFISLPSLGDVWFPHEEVPTALDKDSLVGQPVTFELYRVPHQPEKPRARQIRVKEVKPREPSVRIRPAAPTRPASAAAAAATAAPVKTSAPASTVASTAQGKPVTVEGRVKSYSPKDGYGFIAAKAPCAPSGADFWFSKKEVPEIFHLRLRAGSLVGFEPIKLADGKTQARNVRML